jgi:uncharacterized membrane protein YhaH (DUF805 family)
MAETDKPGWVSLKGSSFYALLAITAVTIAAAALRIYKGTHTGMIYDEAYSLMFFGDSYKDALTLYLNPNNNHVLNSLMMVFGQHHLAAWEWSFRAHTIAFSLLYCVSIAYLAWALFRNGLLRVLLASLLLFQWFIFDLSYLARGYSIALASFYAGLAVLVLCLKHKLPRRYIYVPALTLVVMNFLSMGSMLSALTLVLTLNICYISLFSHLAIDGVVNRLKSSIIHLCIVPVCSAAMLYMLYMYIYRDIIAARGKFLKVTLTHHVREVLWKSMFSATGAIERIAYFLFLMLAAAALVYGLSRMLSGKKSGERASNAQMLIILTTAILFVVLFVYRNVLGLSLGYARNSVFILPLFLLCCGILVETSLTGIASGSMRKAIMGLLCATVAVMTWTTRPSMDVVEVSDWAAQSASRSLLLCLRNIDPERTWKVSATFKGQFILRPMQCYERHGYNVIARVQEEFDVIVCNGSDQVSYGPWYKEDLFRRFKCKVALSPAIQQQYGIKE